MNITPKTMAREIRVAREARVESERLASVAPRTVLRYSSETGQPTMRERIEAACDHTVLHEIYADLPGDRSVGYCKCGKNYIDTGTWDERNK